MDEEDSISVRCPLCGDEHVYALAVERSAVAYFKLPKDSVRVKFRRIFVCLATGKPFTATIALEARPGVKIRDVTVLDGSAK